MVVEKGQNTPLKAVSKKYDTPHPDTIKRSLKRLKEEFGYGESDD
tara:strand:- start:524 stop:658 length:135 start_codon:yes stop_codon:yes gene_type:complete